MTTFYVSVAAFNNEGQVCELRIPQPSVPALLSDESAKAYKENERVLDEEGDCTELTARCVMD
jgi:hypothetical protein